MKDKGLLIIVSFIIILISITAVLLSRYEIDDNINFSNYNVGSKNKERKRFYLS